MSVVIPVVFILALAAVIVFVVRSKTEPAKEAEMQEVITSEISP
jgi:flagellar basal body-associated protein FliL